MATQKSSKKILNTLLGLQGVSAIAVVGTDGFVIDSEMNAEIDIDMLGAVISTGFGSTEIMASELKLGKINQNIIECDEGKILLSRCGDVILGVITNPDAAIGNIRYNIMKVISDLASIY